MFDIFNTIGAFVRGSLAVGLAALWGWFSVLLNGWNGIGSAAMGLATMAVVVGVGAVAIILGFSCLLRLMRNPGKPLAKSATIDPSQAAADPDPEFDADAVIARHLAARAELHRSVLAKRPARVSAFRECAAHYPAAQQFGRRGLRA